MKILKKIFSYFKKLVLKSKIFLTLRKHFLISRNIFLDLSFFFLIRKSFFAMIECKAQCQPDKRLEQNFIG